MALILKSNKPMIRNSNVEAKVAKFKERVLADGGTILKESAIAEAYLFADSIGLNPSNDLVFFASPDFAVRYSDGVSKVDKMYNLLDAGAGNTDVTNSLANKVTMQQGATNKLLTSDQRLGNQTFSLNKSYDIPSALSSVFIAHNIKNLSETTNTVFNLNLGTASDDFAVRISEDDDVRVPRYFPRLTPRNGSTIDLPQNYDKSAPTSRGQYYSSGLTLLFEQGTEKLRKEGVAIPDLSIATKLRFSAPSGAARGEISKTSVGSIFFALNITPEQAYKVAGYLSTR